MFSYGRMKEGVTSEHVESAANPPVRKINGLVLLGGVLLLVILCLSLAIALGVTSTRAGNAGKGICNTASCLQVAAYITQNLNESVDPCQDFYTFSCGGWMQRNYIKAEGAYISVVSNHIDNNRDKIEALFSNKIYKDDAPDYEKKLKIFYQSCMDEVTRSKHHDSKIKELIKTKLGGWYGFDKSVLSNWDFGKALLALHADLRSSGVLFRSYIRKSRKDKGKQAITVGIIPIW